MRLENLMDARADAERALSLTDSGGSILDLWVYNLLAQDLHSSGRQLRC